MDQVCFTGESNCERFKGHPWKSNICTSCMKDVSKHAKEAVDEEQLVQALEHTQKGAKTASLICEGPERLGKLFLGGFKSAVNEQFLKEENIRGVVNTAGDGIFRMFGNKFEKSYKEMMSRNNVDCLHLQWQDSVSYNITHQDMEQVVHFIHNHRKNGAVLVHCAQGKSRSTTAVIAYLMSSESLNSKNAFTFVKERRKMAEPNVYFIHLLHELESSELLPRLRNELS